jgi:hypothetical protein
MIRNSAKDIFIKATHPLAQMAIQSILSKYKLSPEVYDMAFSRSGHGEKNPMVYF